MNKTFNSFFNWIMPNRKRILEVIEHIDTEKNRLMRFKTAVTRIESEFLQFKSKLNAEIERLDGRGRTNKFDLNKKFEELIKELKQELDVKFLVTSDRVDDFEKFLADKLAKGQIGQKKPSKKARNARETAKLFSQKYH